MYSRAYVEITNICNMNCSFCHGHSRELRRMTEDEFIQILDKLDGVTEYLYFHLMGEPLTHPLLPRFLTLAQERGFHPTVTTNGTLLRKRGQEILDAGAYKVVISLHSFEGEAGERLSEYLTTVANFAAAAADRGIIAVLRLWNRGHDGGKNDYTIEKLKQLLPGEWSENSRNIRVRKNLHVELGDRFIWPDKEAEVVSERVFCYGLRDHFGILVDGTVVPCCLDSDGVINLGNIFTEEIGDILSSKRAVAIKKGFDGRRPAEDLCRRCSYATRFNK
ncbi:MAG: radical SAM protein [Ruminococcaceae bacterium]|nr:radical SAM protein [Oscillospiraceae bacterium]